MLFLPIYSSQHPKRILNKEITTWEFKSASIIDLSKQKGSYSRCDKCWTSLFLSVSWKNVSEKTGNGVASEDTQKAFLQVSSV